MLFLSILASLLVMLVSLSGKLLTIRGVGPIIEKNLHFLVSFAAGVLLVVAYKLGHEIVEHTGSMTQGLPWVALGAVAILIAFRYIPQFHHHHDKGEHAHNTIDANRVVVSDALHNIGDGAVIAVSFITSPMLGIASTVSIMTHELLQEISQFFVLREAGLATRTALLYNLAASASILIGTIGGYAILQRFEALEVPILGLAVGSYIIVVFHDLIPHSLSTASTSAHRIRHIAYFIAGLALMSAITALLPHSG